MEGTGLLENPQEQAKQALLATLAAARNNPKGKDVAEYLTKLLAEMEGIGGNVELPGSDRAEDDDDEEGASGMSGKPETKSVDPAEADAIMDTPITHLWDMAPDDAAKKRQEMQSLWEALEREEEEWIRRKQAAAKDDTLPTSNVQDELPDSSSGSGQHQPKLEADLSRNTAASGSKPKKSVKFEDGTTPNPLDSTDLASPQWGDVVPATLKNRIRPIAKATHVMKFNVVERTSSVQASSRRARMTEDSDDEDGDDNASSGSEQDGDELEGEDRNSEDESGSADSEASGHDEDSDGEELGRAELASRARRKAILQENQARSLAGSSGPEWVPLDASVAESHANASAGPSRFKSRKAGPPSVPVTALGPNAQDVIREGKLMDGKLVVPADTDSDDNRIGEAGRKVIELLRKRDSEHDDEENQGDLGALASTSNQNAWTVSRPTPVIRGLQERSARESNPNAPAMQGTAPGATSTKVSRFKATQQQPRRPSRPPTAPLKSELDLIDESAAAASDQMIAALKAQYRATTAPTAQSAPVITDTSSSAPNAVVDSPSFPRPVPVSQGAGPKVASVMVREVSERGESKEGRLQMSTTGVPQRVSKFKANRM